MNKTWLVVEVQYFKFIGQNPCNSHEYDTCNTCRSMGRGGRSGCPWWISSTVRLSTKVSHQGHNQLHARYRWVRELQGLRCRQVLWSILWYSDASLVHLLFAHWAGGQEVRMQGNDPDCTSLLNFSQISITLSHNRWRVLLQQPTMPGEMTSWSPDPGLNSSSDSIPDPYCHLSLA